MTGCLVGTLKWLRLMGNQVRFWGSPSLTDGLTKGHLSVWSLYCFSYNEQYWVWPYFINNIFFGALLFGYATVKCGKSFSKLLKAWFAIVYYCSVIFQASDKTYNWLIYEWLDWLVAVLGSAHFLFFHLHPTKLSQNATGWLTFNVTGVTWSTEHFFRQRERIWK